MVTRGSRYCKKRQDTLMKSYFKGFICLPEVILALFFRLEFLFRWDSDLRTANIKSKLFETAVILMESMLNLKIWAQFFSAHLWID